MASPMDFNLAPQERAADSFDKAMDRLNKMQKLWNSNFASDATSYNHFEIKQNEQHYILKVEIPGFEREQVKLEVQERNLILSSRETKASATDRTSDDLDLGVFRSEWSLPNDADLEKITGRLKNGLLTIIVPKAPNQERAIKEIPIS